MLAFVDPANIVILKAALVVSGQVLNGGKAGISLKTPFVKSAKDHDHT